jgi:predicted Zn-ribbon and HTH transcriptional regulator
MHGFCLKKTNEEFLKEVEQLRGNEYTFLEPYNGVRGKILVRHNVCGNEYLTTPGSFLHDKSQCCQCHERQHSDFVQRLESAYPNEYTVLGKYKTMNTKILVKHNKCGHEWYITPSKLLTRRSCPECKKQKLAEAFKFSIEEVSEYISRYGFELLSKEYVNARQNLVIRCPKGHIYEARFGDFKKGSRCPVCNLSKGEEKIKQYLIDNNIEFERQYRFEDLKNIAYLRFDFAVFNNDELNFLIEYDGQQHYKPIPFNGANSKMDSAYEQTVRNDAIKNEYCEEHNIKLIRIPYWDFDNIEQILKEAI